MSITFFMGAGPAVKPVRHFLFPDRIEGASADGPCRGREVWPGTSCRGELHSPSRHPAGMNDCPRVGAAPAGAGKFGLVPHVGAYRIRPPDIPQG